MVRKGNIILTDSEKSKNIDKIILRLNNLWLSIKHLDYSNFKNYKSSSVKELESIINIIKDLKFLKYYFVDVITRKIKTEKGKYDKDFECWVLKDLELSLSEMKSFTTGNISHSKLFYNFKASVKSLRLFKIFLDS